MKKLFLSAFAIFALSFSSLSQDLATKAYNIIKECACREVVMISAVETKAYSTIWLEGITLEDNFIVFTKGDNIHRWNTEKITFIEKGNGFVKIFME